MGGWLTSGGGADFIPEVAHLLMVPSKTGSVAGAPGWVWRYEGR